jgi:hypothetical protein
MKKFIPILIVGVLLISGLGAVATPQENVESEKLTVTFNQPIIQSEEQFVTVKIDEADSFIMKQGKPMLPSYIETFAYPFGTKINSVTCTPANIQMQTISKDIEPTPKAVIVGQTVIASQTEPINYGTEPYPSNWYEYDVGYGRYNGEPSVIVEVEVNPVKYHPVEKIIEWAKEINIIIEYDPPVGTMSFNDDYELVVIGPSEFSSQLSPLITHKIGRGVTAKFVSLNDIYSGTYFPATGRDNQEKIKYFIKDAFENWSTGNILLVGSSSKLPIRTARVGIVQPPSQEIFVSDLYYADIYDQYGAFCSWDSNGNNIFGEYEYSGNTDEMDLHPDLYLGRLACRDTSEVTTMVNKIKTYENTPAYQEGWFTNLVVVGGDTFNDNNDVDEGEYINQLIIDMMAGFNPNKQWVTNGKLTGSFPNGVNSIKNAINDGAGFVDFSGHGNPAAWATHPHLQHGTWVPTPTQGIYNFQVQTLSNGNKLPIVAVEACSTSKFNSDPNCFNWALMHNSNGGAIGSFGATALGLGYGGTSISLGLIGKMNLDTFRAYKLDYSVTFGEMWANALERYIKPGMLPEDVKTVLEWEPFGDPTLAIGEESDPPNKPDKPDGPTNGASGQEHTYTTSTTDPDGDDVSYMFDWGDDTTSGWVGPYPSGQTGSAKKTWTSQGDFVVKVVAKDEHGRLSVWSDPLEVSMPRNRAFFNSILLEILERILERFPLLEQILASRPIISGLLDI